MLDRRPLGFKSLVKTALLATMAIAPTWSSASFQQRPTIAIPPSQPPFELTPRRPRLVVLLHGVTAEEREAPEAHINSSAHARYYWGPRFIEALIDHPGTDRFKVIQPTKSGTMNLRSIPPPGWVESKPLLDGPNNLAPVVMHSAINSDTIENNTKEIQNYVRLQTKPSSNPPTHVMVNFRKGALHLMPQVGATIDQVYDTYKLVYGGLPENAQPQIYFVGHSFGGVVARTIFANPTGPDLWGNKLTAEQRQRADFLRARTVFLFTLSTPHHGSLMGDSAQDLAAFVRRAGGWGSALGGGIDTLLSVEPLKRLEVETKFVNLVRQGMQKALDNISGERDCLQDLVRTDEFNRGLIAPDTARRTDGSLIPIYTASGRSPGELYFDRTRGTFIPNFRWLPNTIIDILFSSERRGFEAGALYLINSLLYREGYGKDAHRPWGTAKVPEGDMFTSPFKGLGPAQPRALSAGFTLSAGLVAGVLYDGLTGTPFTYGPDGEYDSDGFLGFESGHGLNLTGGAWYRLYSRTNDGDLMPWDLDSHGSMMFNIGNGLYIQNLMREVGPVGSAGRRSTWPGVALGPVKKRTLSVQITEVSDPANNLDTITQADFTVYVRIGAKLFSKNAPDDTKLVKNLGTFSRNDLVQSVIPICISVMERDTPDPDDYCTINPENGRDNLYFYFDTRTNMIWGDVNGVAGEEFSKAGRGGKDNRAAVKFKVTVS